MLMNEIEKLKTKLNHMIGSEDFTYNEILEVSQELDLLIVEYLRENYNRAM
ncbi:MAG: Spo0E like sporulation regulatory protein [Clostridia bacterium]|nr:Spo0E like sporulation regulatory protein [Clostridia bacterium]